MVGQELRQKTPGSVSKRKVFYIPGYDPHPPRRYRELYRTEAIRQSEISEYDITFGRPIIGEDDFGWQVLSQIDGTPVQADVTVLPWTDIVKKSMSRGVLSTYWQLVRTAWIYTRTGTLRSLMMLRKGPIIAAFYPVLMLLLQLLAAFVVARVAAGAVSWAIYPNVGWVVFPLVFVMILRWFRSIDSKIYAYYLMHDYAHAVQLRGAYSDADEAVIKAFRHRIADAMEQDYDEVLVVGHSSGAHLAVSILADLIRKAPPSPQGPALALLTLGQAIPMMSFLPEARRLRGDLAFLSTRDDLCWVDVSAPADGCSFALCDPVAVSGVAPRNKKWPLVISAAFSQTLSPEMWQKLKRRYFRLHFQYLCAFDRPNDYDYFQITAGPLTLAERFLGRAPSKSRIDVEASPYTDT